MSEGLRFFLSMWHMKNKVYATNPHTLEVKASIRREIDSISEDELMRVNAIRYML